MPKASPQIPVTVIVGPAHSAKTGRVLREFREALGCGEDAVLLLPTTEAATSLRTALLLDGTFDAFVGPRILTFVQFAEQVLQHEAPEVRPVDAMVEDELLARIVEALAADGAIRHHAGVLEFRGFVRAVRQFITEIKRAEIAPEDFAKFARRKGGSAADRELSAIYSRYQDTLQGLDLYDEEGRFWRARLLVSEGRLGPFARLRSILLDGFYDFTPTQLGLLEALVGRGVSLTMTLPLEDDAGRGELFETAAATLATLRARFAVTEEAPPRGKEAADAALGWITDHLFRASVPSGAPAPTSIAVIEAPGAAAEVREIAREVKRLHVEERVPLESIAVLFRTLGEYRDMVEDAFEEFGIPVRIAQGMRLSDTPVGQAMLQLARVPVEGWSRVDVFALLKSNYVSASAVGLGDGGLSLSRFEDLAAEAGIIGGREAWLRNLKALRERIASRLETLGAESDEDAPRPETPEELRAIIADSSLAEAAAGRLFALFQPLESARTAEECVKALRGVARALRIAENLRCASREIAARDLESLASVEDALDGLVRTAAIVERPECAPADFARNLALAFADLTVSRHAAGFGRVHVREVHDVRALSFDVVFIGGLLERSFPRMHREGPFYDDRDRDEMSRAGLGLEPKRLSQREERFLFYLAATRAKKRLYLSYPVTDREGKEKLVSYYVDEVRKLFEPAHSIEVRRVSLSKKTPPLAQAGSRMELRRAAALRLSAPKLAGPLEINRAAAYLWARGSETALVLKRALEGEAERDSWSFFGAHDGVLSHPSAAAFLADRFGAEHAFSVTSLERYGGCPFAFFLGYVLDLEPPPEPPAQIEAVDEGQILHRTLRDFYAERRDTMPHSRIAESECEAATARLIEIAERHLGRFRRENPDMSDGLFRLQREGIRETLAAFVQLEIDETAKDEFGMSPTHFEAAFGFPKNPRAAEALSTTERLVLSARDVAPVSVIGRIDRIDVGKAMENSKAPTFRVVDYKRSGAPRAAELAEGTSLQMPVYVLAARDVLFKGREMEPVSAVYYELARAKARAMMNRLKTPRNAPEWDECLTLARDYILSFAVDIRGGLFPVVRRGGGPCPAWCEFCEICRYSPFRAKKKSGEYQPWFMREKGRAGEGGKHG